MSDDMPAPKDRFSPRDFLRARRPERFSDSVPLERPILDRLTLETYLQTLTSRSQESQFEEFARQLLQREVVPNLKPHTGPTGGGDSKVDSESYPVAEAIAAGWYVGAGGKSDSERWAVAISAKRDWATKVKADMASLAGTNRGYTTAFFVSNQFISDKKRAQIEDRLTHEHGIKVHIFDLTWVLDKVFGGRHEQLAISALSMKVSTQIEIRKGPQDAANEGDLADLEARIREALQGQPTFTLADDTLEAALLARNLERPRTEIDGMFVRADRAAREHGTSYQQVRVAYEQAWTAFFWHEDLNEFVRNYESVQQLTRDSDNVLDAEMLTNLWMLLIATCRRGDLDKDTVGLAERTVILRSTLARLAAHRERPSVSLQARALFAMVTLTDAPSSKLAAPLKELREVIKESEGLIGFPLLRLSDLITNLSDLFIGNLDFEHLFNFLVEATAKRQGEVAGARMLLKLGAEQLNGNRPYDAIRTLGRVLRSLYKHESRGDMVQALRLCASAYERVGLLWAARGTVLNAASIATNQWWSESEITLAQNRSYNRMKWIELQLGRVPHLLAWHRLDLATRRVLVSDGYDEKALSLGDGDFDGILGILLLRADLWQLKQMEGLPDVLHGLGLHTAAITLEFALGHEEEMRHEKGVITIEEQRQMMAALAEQPAASDLPSGPVLHSEQKQTYHSVILGCKVEATVDNKEHCIEVAESFFGTAEALLATAVMEGILPRVGMVRLRIRHSDLAEFPFTVVAGDRDGMPELEVRCAAFGDASTPEKQDALKDALLDLIARFLAQGFHVDSKATLERLFGEERGLERSVGFAGTFAVMTNVLGASPPTSIENWISGSSRKYPLIRREEWNAAARREAQDVARLRPRRSSDISLERSAPPPDLFDFSSVKHTDLGFESVIREPLWNKARWRGVLWAVAEGMPPWMVLGFENEEAAAKIITHLVEDVGQRDPSNRLRIAIVRGISKRNPAHYRVVIGSNVDKADFKKFGALMFRLQTMEPQSKENLDRFLAAYNERGSYLIGVTAVNPTNMEGLPQPPLRAGYIHKDELLVREAWQIGLHEMDSVGVLPSDDVAIPAGRENDAPVLELLKAKRTRRTAESRGEKSRRPNKPATSRARAKAQKQARKKNRKK